MSQTEPAPEPQTASPEETRMTLMDHLLELRTRLMWVVGALLLGTLLSMVFVSPLIEFIIAPLTVLGAKPTAIGPTDCSWRRSASNTSRS